VANGDLFQLLRSRQALSDENQLISRAVAVRPGGPGCSRGQDERDQEEAHPGKGGVSRVLNIFIQTTPGGDAGGGVAGEAAARVTFTYPEGEREKQGVTITCQEGEEKEQRSAIQVSVGGIVYRETAAKQERIQLQEQHERVPREGGEGVSGQDGTGKEEEGTRTVQQQ